MPTDALDLVYDLNELPTAQHRAGLAGLYVVADAMRRRGLMGVPMVALRGPRQLLLTLTPDSLVALFNDLYDATIEEARQTAARKDRGQVIPPLRVETEDRTDRPTGKTSRRNVYVYPQVVPKAPFLQDLGMPPIWLKLWRDLVWSTLRGIPTTRRPYEDQAAGRDVREAQVVWAELKRQQALQRRGKPFTAEVSSTVFIGAQAFNAEGVRFVGRPDQNLLLHFWPVVMGVGEAWQIALEGGKINESPVGYVLAVPDVVDLEGFTVDFTRAVAQLDPKPHAYRPRLAVLSLPEEGGLVYLRQLTQLAATRALRGDVRYSVAGTEVYHMVKKGNNVRLLAANSVPARPDLLDRYEAIRERTHNLLFRAQVIRNLLAERPWYAGFNRVFAVHSADLFVGRAAGSFSGDVWRKLQAESIVTASGGRSDE